MTFYLANADGKNFQPANTTFALLPAIEPELRKLLKLKADRCHFQTERGLKAFKDWLARIGEHEWDL